jgi:hypothetical protein
MSDPLMQAWVKHLRTVGFKGLAKIVLYPLLLAVIIWLSVGLIWVVILDFDWVLFVFLAPLALIVFTVAMWRR